MGLEIGVNRWVTSISINAALKIWPNHFVPTSNTSKNMKFSEICFWTGSDFLVISKSIDKCNMSLLMVVVLGIESTHHYVRWQGDSPPLLQLLACSLTWKPSFWSKKWLEGPWLFWKFAKGESDLAVSGWNGSWNISSLGTPKAQQAKSPHPMPDSSWGKAPKWPIFSFKILT